MSDSGLMPYSYFAALLVALFVQICGTVHSFSSHGVGHGITSIVFPPYAAYRAVESLWHEEAPSALAETNTEAVANNALSATAKAIGVPPEELIRRVNEKSTIDLNEHQYAEEIAEVEAVLNRLASAEVATTHDFDDYFKAVQLLGAKLGVGYGTEGVRAVALQLLVRYVLAAEINVEGHRGVLQSFDHGTVKPTRRFLALNQELEANTEENSNLREARDATRQWLRYMGDAVKLKGTSPRLTLQGMRQSAAEKMAAAVTVQENYLRLRDYLTGK